MVSQAFGKKIKRGSGCHVPLLGSAQQIPVERGSP
jgi:hypothetical protein